MPGPADFLHQERHHCQVSAIGTGGLRCYTDASLRPSFSGSANVR